MPYAMFGLATIDGFLSFLVELVVEVDSLVNVLRVRSRIWSLGTPLALEATVGGDNPLVGIAGEHPAVDVVVGI